MKTNINHKFKIILSFWVILFLTNNIIAQVNYNIKFDKGKFSFTLNEDGNYSIIPNEDSYFFIEDTTLPALPYTTINILVPKNVNIENLKINTTHTIILQNITLAKNPQLMKSSEMSNSSSNANYAKKRYPDENIQFLSINKMQDFHFASFSICPFIYDNENKTLSIITDFNISFQYNHLSSTKSNVQERYDMEDVVKSIVINPNELDVLYPAKESKSTSDTRRNSSDVEYLIITSEELSSSFNPLKAWKIRKGIKTEILTTSYIYDNYAGATNQLKIKNCLKYYYENKNLKWVLLGGDNTIVPVQGCYGNVNNGGIIDNTIPCDLFYACFDNAFDWNANGNNLIGEYNDNIDMAPEIFVSRTPIRTSTHVSAFVNKTLNYEQNPPFSNYVKTMLLVGSRLSFLWADKSDAHHRSEAMYNQYVAPYWTGVRTRFYDTGTDFPGDASYNLTTANLQTVLNSGYHFVNTAVHGNVTIFGLESGSYSSTNASTLTNSNKSIITTTACNTNAFDNSTDPCLSEAFLRNPNGGCVSYWGGSRHGLYYADTIINNFGPSLDFVAQFYKNLFTGNPSNNSYRFGSVTAQAKSYYIGTSSYNSGYRWVQFSQNAIGDPELSIFTENSLTFSSATVSQSCATVVVNTGVSGCDIALTSQDMGNSYFEVQKNVSFAIFENVDCSYYVTIIKHNYKPFTYQKNLVDTYIQNHIFTSYECVIGKNIFAGRNVTSSKPQGDVIVRNGANVLFVAEEDVLLDGGFEVELGGSFEIQ
ncbi:MAG: hypothetical protein GX330_05605 [Bacteroidales bacterium]|nr:hypothetical protein [Bacteroidales bacterium]